MRIGLIALFAALLLFTVPASAEAGTCPWQPQFGPDARTYTGHYQNLSYGFSTDIPSGLVGIDNNDPEYQRGFSFLLGERGNMSVFAEPNSAGFDQPQSAAKTRTGYLRKHVAQFASVRYTSLSMASRPATQAVVEFTCPGTGERYESISIFSLDRDKEFLYTLTWQGKSTDAASAAKIIRHLEEAWRFVPAK